MKNTRKLMAKESGVIKNDDVIIGQYLLYLEQSGDKDIEGLDGRHLAYWKAKSMCDALRPPQRFVLCLAGNLACSMGEDVRRINAFFESDLSINPKIRNAHQPFERAAHLAQLLCRSAGGGKPGRSNLSVFFTSFTEAQISEELEVFDMDEDLWHLLKGLIVYHEKIL